MHPEHPFPCHGRGSRRGATRGAVYLIAGALLVPLSTGCEPAGPVDVPPGMEHALPADPGAMRQTAQTIQIPEPPRLLTDVGDRESLTRRFSGYTHRTEPAAVWLRRLEQAPTWNAAVHHAANAAEAIAALPRGAQRVWYPRLTRTVEEVSHLSSLFVRPPEPGRDEIIDLLGGRFVEGVYTLCFVGFGLPGVLDAIPDHAQTTFLFAPFWRQDCDVGEVRVEPLVYNHYHLNFEDPDIGTCVDDGVFGREIDGECQAVEDFTAEPRYVAPHYGNEIIRIRAHQPFIGNPISFDVVSFANVGDEPVRFRYENEDGQVFEWNHLGGKTNWGVSAFDAVEVLITHAGTSLDCGPGTEAGEPGGCQVDLSIYSVDEFVIGLRP